MTRVRFLKPYRDHMPGDEAEVDFDAGTLATMVEYKRIEVVGSDADEAFDTIGGLIAHEMGHVPRRGEQLALCGLQFVVLHTRAGAVRWFKVSRAEPPAPA